ncbi:hypothetical protein GPECTOR_17g951 [Gonium pectorale]|uniref:SGNH hydrolase-type esterase domain-containing protein n=1 Tax=Gonium pectorale TaxID=33097 RepID=A0A150GKH8_GONPE|nr:hypothetical protein GPECTOR_17g951 [Gonium pectorale]|eukprot:KXZ50312.1 hypothetical protein GPECTOR_17g951 [Gonium pectorale]
MHHLPPPPVALAATEPGNVFRATNSVLPDPKVYWQGRFTNGYNWVDYLNMTLSNKVKAQVLNYAYGGASACSSAYTATNFPFVREMDGQTAAFVADVQSGKIPSGKNTRIIPLQLIGGNDVLLGLTAAARSGRLPTEAELVSLVAALVRCRLGALRAYTELPGVRDAVLLPLGPIYVAPVVPAFMRPMVKELIDTIDARLEEAVAALQAELDGRPKGAPGAGVRVHALGGNSWIARGSSLTQPPFANVTDPCFWNRGSVLRLTPGLVPCADPENYLFYDDTHISSRFHKWVALEGVVPRLQQLRILPLGI